MAAAGLSGPNGRMSSRIAVAALWMSLPLVGCGGSTESTPEPTDGGVNDVAGDDGVSDTVAETGECPVSTSPAPGLVITDRGAVQGAEAGATWSFKNIPYAAPPVGALRWKPTQRAACWTGVRPATSWGTVCPRLGKDGSGVFEGDEDCLQLNVWTPKDASKGPLPVMVWIHGGGHQVGSAVEETNGVRIYDAQRFVERAGVVVVTINYRLGALGFLAHEKLGAENADKASGAYGSLDQIEALRWVQRNAKAFGGDASKVTVFGESAGGAAICTLVASPLSSGLFQRAIMQSGGCPSRKLADAQTFGAQVFGAAKCETAADPVACMRALPAKDVVSALPIGVDVAGANRGYTNVVDGVVLPDASFDRIAAGKHNKVPWIVGTMSDETSRSVPLARTATAAEYEAAVRKLFAAVADAVLAQYPASDYPSPWHAYVQMTSDAKFVCGARKALRTAAAAGTAGLFRYSMSRPIEGPLVKPFGAWHGLDVLFVFDHLDIAGYTPNTGDKQLVADVEGYFGRFAATGDPNGGGAFSWPSWDTSDPYVLLDEPLTAAKGLRAKQCDFWDTLL